MKHALKGVLYGCLVAVLISLMGCGGGSSGSSGDTGGLGRITGTVQEMPLQRGSRALGDRVTVSIEGINLATQAAVGGNFKLDRVPAGLHTLVARTTRRAFALVVAVKAGSETSVGEIVLQEAGQISGLVVSAATREPIPEALVTVTEMVYENTDDQMPHPVRAERTNAQGSYTVAGLPAGEYLVSISKEGFETASLVLPVAAGSTTPGDAALSTSSPTERGGIEGAAYLVADDGHKHPLAGVLIRLAKPDDPLLMRPMPGTATDEKGSPVVIYPDGRPEESGSEIYTFTGEDGTYKLEGVPVGEYIAVAVRPGLESDQKTVTVTADQVSQVDFNLAVRKPEAGIIEGVVVNAEDKQPVSGAWVYAIFSVEPVPLGARKPGQGHGGSHGGSGGGLMITPDDFVLFATTDERGQYRLLVPSAVTSIGIHARGFEQQEVPVTVIPGGSVRLNVELKSLTTEQVTLTGSVFTVGSDGQSIPVFNASVYAEAYSDYPTVGFNPEIYTAETDENGKYSLPVPAGIYLVSAVKDNLRSELLLLKIYEDTEQDLVLNSNGGTSPPSTEIKK